MKKIIGLVVLLGLIAALGVVYLPTLKAHKVNVLVESILPGETESPYSLKWEAAMARVVDQEGNGVAGATVTFTKHLAPDCNGKPTQQPPAWQGISVKTNETGEFAYPPEIWQVEDKTKEHRIEAKIETAGFLPRSDAEVGVNYGDDNGTIDIFRIGRIEGAVIDPNGQPIAAVPVRLNSYTQYKNPSNGCHGCFGATATTDTNGGFVFDKVPPGMHIIEFPSRVGSCDPNQKTEEVPFKDYDTHLMVTMKDGQVKSDVFIDLRQRRGTVTGKVVDHHHRPMAGVNAILLRHIKVYHQHGWSSSSYNLKTALTDQDGVYVMKHVPAGEYQIKADYPYEKNKNYKSGNPLSIYLAGSQEVSLNLVLERQDGSAAKPSNRNESLFEVPLPKGLGPREMMIVDPRGNGIAGASVVFDNKISIEDHKTGQTTTKDWRGVSLTTDARGVFVLPETIAEMEGKWVGCRAQIKAEGFWPRSETIGSHRLREDRRIDILPLSQIRGQVIGMNDQPIEGAAVSLLDQMTAYRNPGSTSSGGGYGGTGTDKDGRFKFEGVPEGLHVLEYRVLVPDTKKEHKGRFVVSTQSGKNVDDLVIDLRQETCAARGRVLDWEGKPIKKASVRLCKDLQWGFDGYCTVSREFYRGEPTNRKGDYSIENIRPGVYEIEAVLEGKQPRTSEKMTIAVSDGQAIELDIRLQR